MDVRAADSSNGIAFLVSAGVVYEIIAAACSSPQTAEINASTRADTLMKWVHVGIVQAAALVFIAAAVDRKHRGAIIAGGSTAAVVMYGCYWHAKRAGLKNGGPSTEGGGNPAGTGTARRVPWAA